LNFGIPFLLSLIFAAVAIALVVAGSKTNNRLYYYCAALAAVANLVLLGYGLLTVMFVG